MAHFLDTTISEPVPSRDCEGGDVGDNTLNVGQPRLGWFIDGNPDTPDIAVMLENSGSQLVLTMPTKGMAADDAYSRWFSSGLEYGDDPDRTKFSYEPPRINQFHDKDGAIVLVGCRASGMSSAMSAGHGRIVANYALLGGEHLRYDRINGLRSVLPALTPWTRMKSVHLTPEMDAGGRVQSVSVQLKSPPDVGLSHAMNLTLSPTWKTSYPDKVGTFSAHDVVELSTSTKKPRGWDEHLVAHIALRELLVIAAWKPFGFSGLRVSRTDDPQRLLDGDAIGERWCDVLTHRLPAHEAWSSTPHFLFYFADIGSAGIRRWLRLRAHFARAIQPLVAIADQRGSLLETRLLLSSLGLEALAYQLALDNNGQGLNSRSQLASFQVGLQLVLDDMIHIPLPDPEGWKARSADCYRGVKHADNATPDSLTMANTLRENLVVMRFWLARRLGVRTVQLEKRLALDPLSQEWALGRN